MIIYQVHISGEEYGESYDYITNSYLDVRKAKEEVDLYKKNMDKLLKQYDKCFECPINNQLNTKRKYDKNVNLVTKYCDDADITFYGNYASCLNVLSYCSYEDFQEECYFKALDVIE